MGYADRMRVSDVLSVLRKLAPEALAEPWDKVGLQLGDGDWPIDSAAGDAVHRPDRAGDA